MNLNNFSSDRPVTKEKEDQFQRYSFSQRIAQTIIERTNNDCIVIALYGVWGEGKTSALNFIENELNNSQSVITVKFNPWRFSDENSLLLQFFKTLANSINSKLKNRSENVGELLKKYGSILSFNIPYIGNIGSSVKSIGEALDEVNIDELKLRIEKSLIDSTQKVVVFIDDIDRLDKQEIHSILRLVKLNADFDNVTYILSFDERMVAYAIGDRFGEGNVISDQNFLEKIIQIPLRIPVAQPEALKDFCYRFIDSAISVQDYEIKDEELRRFANQFTNNILPRLMTPRMAVQYGNAISFSLPLLKGEVNIVDLLLIEAMKTFYPAHYDFIKYNPEFFIESYTKQFTYEKNEDKKNRFKAFFAELQNLLTDKQKQCAKELLINLFPQLNEVFSNHHYHEQRALKWYQDKHICSSNYFDRYFTYTVAKNDISDIEFKDFLQKIHTYDIVQISKTIKDLVKKSSPEVFLRKIRNWEEDFDFNISVKLVKAIVKVSSIFTSNQQFFGMDFQSPRGQSIIFINQTLKRENFSKVKYSLALDILKEAEDFEYAYRLYSWFRPAPDRNDNSFSADEYDNLSRFFINRAIDEAKGRPMFEAFPESFTYIFDAWHQIHSEGLEKYLTDIFKSNPQSIKDLLLGYAPTITSSSHPEPYKGDITFDRYNYLTNIIDKDFIYSVLRKGYNRLILSTDDVQWAEHMGITASAENLIKQFIFWYKQPKKVEDN